jgi:hypothetical protein
MRVNKSKVSSAVVKCGNKNAPVITLNRISFFFFARHSTFFFSATCYVRARGIEWRVPTHQTAFRILFILLYGLYIFIEMNI